MPLHASPTTRLGPSGGLLGGFAIAALTLAACGSSPGSVARATSSLIFPAIPVDAVVSPTNRLPVDLCADNPVHAPFAIYSSGSLGMAVYTSAGTMRSPVLKHRLPVSISVCTWLNNRRGVSYNSTSLGAGAFLSLTRSHPMDALLLGIGGLFAHARSGQIIVGAIVHPATRVEVQYFSGAGSLTGTTSVQLNGGYFSSFLPVSGKDAVGRVIAFDAKGRVLAATTCNVNDILPGTIPTNDLGSVACSWDLRHNVSL